MSRLIDENLKKKKLFYFLRHLYVGHDVFVPPCFYALNAYRNHCNLSGKYVHVVRNETKLSHFGYQKGESAIKNSVGTEN